MQDCKARFANPGTLVLYAQPSYYSLSTAGALRLGMYMGMYSMHETVQQIYCISAFVSVSPYNCAHLHMYVCTLGCLLSMSNGKVYVGVSLLQL